MGNAGDPDQPTTPAELAPEPGESGLEHEDAAPEPSGPEAPVADDVGERWEPL
ncbi:hypothetical protein CLV30_12750 [Haloactinopolyspora alba]|uniref:Uncharacterized protein n=1 Tax=Haloactinopolyspora alba TaxID=648780 RepID=A0A2P8DFW8_9ACTN|nr:hypothetical protein [Haloactinopolyspora alba]PSK96109.1 hypothetical protein CLV30_12750 [Haloactinopolyspora alba]